MTSEEGRFSVGTVSRRAFIAAAGAGAALALTGCSSMSGGSAMSMPKKLACYKKHFGTLPSGEEVHQFTLTNSQGMVVQMITYGARFQRIIMPDRKGNLGDVILGFTNLADYARPHAMDPYFGATIGRYANRINHGRFTIDGTTYHLPLNNGPCTLHGGPDAFDQQVWDAEPVTELGMPGIRFKLFSPNGENGFPGNLEVDATYILTEDNTIKVHFRALTDKPTVINMCNHAYYNLLGPGTSAMGHELMINADYFTPTNNYFIPTGDMVAVAGTPLDFRKPTIVGSRLKHFPKGSKANFDLLPYGYDYNWCLRNQNEKKLALAAVLSEPTTGRYIRCYTTQPGIQVYTGNFLAGNIKGIGGYYPRHGAITLETQHYPDSPNEPKFPSTLLVPGQMFYQRTNYEFGVQA